MAESSNPDLPEDRPFTIGEFCNHIAPALWRAGDVSPSAPNWPPDLFAIVGSILEESGAYTQVVADWPPEFEPSDSSDFDRRALDDFGMLEPDDWCDWVKLLGRSWRKSWRDERSTPPKAVVAWWDLIVSGASTPITEVRENPELCKALLQSLAVADEACYGLGTGSLNEAINRGGDDLLWIRAEELLVRRRVDASLCLRIDPSRVRVLPKSRTPSCGMTIRSLSLYLSLCRGGEVKVGWYNACGWKPEVERYLNLVLIPWPEEVLPSHFRELRFPDDSPYQPDYSMFSFGGPSGPPGGPQVEQILEAAERIVHKVDGIVLPESSVDVEQFKAAWSVAASKNCLAIAGVRSRKPNGFCGNHVETRFPIMLSPEGADLAPPSRIESVQEKHHRWKLDRSQVVAYGLASQLHPDDDWWEGIELGKRNLNFFAIQPWLTTCVLICEDLARQDPMAEVIRAVGPSLVIALLMDGPQLKTRWPSRYATVLADDPGSSVLTMSSIGMVKLSRPLDLGVKPSRVIALWKDATSASATEIELPEGASAVILSLVNTSRPEQSADGRLDDEDSATLVLGGVHPIFLTPRHPIE